jgi:hypothetical protein
LPPEATTSDWFIDAHLNKPERKHKMLFDAENPDVVVCLRRVVGASDRMMVRTLTLRSIAPEQAFT